jgi:hypothetical protein
MTTCPSIILYSDLKAQGLGLRHDYGSHYRSAEFQHEIGFLGMCSSQAFVRAPEGRGCVERAIRTLKEQPRGSRRCSGLNCTTSSGSSSAMASSHSLSDAERVTHTQQVAA